MPTLPKAFLTALTGELAGGETVALAPATARGIAGLHLYRETAYLLMPILKPEYRAVVDRTLEVIAASGQALA